MAEIIREHSCLLDWHGAKVKYWEYTPSHRRLTLRIERTKGHGNLHLICGFCVHVSGPFSWRDSELEIEQQGESFIVRDVKASFELKCEVISIIENVEPVY